MFTNKNIPNEIPESILRPVELIYVGTNVKDEALVCSVYLKSFMDTLSTLLNRLAFLEGMSANDHIRDIYRDVRKAVSHSQDVAMGKTDSVMRMYERVR